MKKLLQVLALALIPVFAAGAVAPQVVQAVKICCGLPPPPPIPPHVK